MQQLTRLKRPTRFAAALVALCYFWLSAATSFQHNHHAGEEASGFWRAPAAVSSPGSPVLAHARRAAKSSVSHLLHCDACEWQAVNVSPALPAFAFAFTVAPAPRVLTTLPRLLQTRAFAASSRGPPLA